MRISSIVTALATLAPLAAGAQWKPQDSGTNAEFRGLSIVSPRVAWVSGTAGRVLRTTDGGDRWVLDTVMDASRLDLRSIHGANAMTAWAASAGDADKGEARIYRTSDGGSHWRMLYTTDLKGVFFDALAFWDDRRGIALSDPIEGKFFLITTRDGGVTWTRVPATGLPANLTGEAAFAASGTCLVVQGSRNAWIATGGGAQARVFRSTDGGRSWRASVVPVDGGSASSGLFSVAFRDARHGVAVGGDYRKPNERLHNAAITSDGGRTWRLANVPPAGYMSGVSYVPGTRGTYVAVGLAGTSVSSDDGRTWATVDTVAYNAVSFGSRDVGFAVGPRGRVARWAGRVR